MSKRGVTAEEFRDRQDARRRSAALEALAKVMAESTLEVPPAVTEIKRIHTSSGPFMGVEAYELARQVYYLQYGTLADAARAVIASGLSETDDAEKVRGRLRVWWKREEWPQRSHMEMTAIRDANFDGGMFRGDRTCKDIVWGKGASPRGNPCTHTAMKDSEYCFHHDPRPEYVEKRREQAVKLTAGRRKGMVPIKPFQAWCRNKRDELLAERRRKGRIHHNNTGLGFLADAMGVNQSQLKRLIDGTHTRDGTITKIRAKTVIRYVAPLGVTFEDIYGHPPPEEDKATPNVCPECGGYKSHESRTCRQCYDLAAGERCTYVPSTGRRCRTKTAHPSGICKKCREVVEHVPKPRQGKPSFITDSTLLYVLDEYRRVENLAWVAKVLWRSNIGGVASHYKSVKSVRQTLVKLFAKRGWKSREDAESAYWLLLAECGPVEWPEPPAEVIAGGGLVPAEPFNRWLRELHESRGGGRYVGELAEQLGIDRDYLSQRIRGVGAGEKSQVARSTVNRALQGWGDGTTFEQLYAEVAV